MSLDTTVCASSILVARRALTVGVYARPGANSGFGRRGSTGPAALSTKMLNGIHFAIVPIAISHQGAAGPAQKLSSPSNRKRPQLPRVSGGAVLRLRCCCVQDKALAVDVCEGPRSMLGRSGITETKKSERRRQPRGAVLQQRQTQPQKLQPRRAASVGFASEAHGWRARGGLREIRPFIGQPSRDMPWNSGLFAQ